MQELSPELVTHEGYWRLPVEQRRERQQRLVSMPAEWRREVSTKFGPLYEGQQPPLYYWLLYAPFRMTGGLTLPSRVFVLRLVSVVMASLCLPLGYVVGRRALGSCGAALAAVALVAAMPVAAINVARVGNEAPAVALYTLLLYLGLRLFDDPVPRRWWLWTGVALGLGLLTKAYFLTALAAVLAIGLWRRRRTAVAQAAAACAVAVAIGGWWYVQIHAMTGTVSGQIQDTWSAGGSRWAALRTVDWWQAADTLLLSYVWFGAGNFLQVRSWMVHFFGWAAAVSAVGLTRKAGERSVVVMVAFLGAFLCSLAYHVVVTHLLIQQSMSNGWYLYALVFAEVPLALMGLRALAPAKLGHWLAPCGALSFAALDLFGMTFLLAPYGLGLIGHVGGGRVPAFRWSQLSGLAPGELVERMAANRPYLPSGEWFAAAWAVYVCATLGLVAIACWRSGIGGGPGEGRADLLDQRS
jgi:4-amino-4-deoxy-L-arabinose transferase-like glycosyltransferase